jgi:hypothetical protein
MLTGTARVLALVAVPAVAFAWMGPTVFGGLHARSTPVAHLAAARVAVAQASNPVTTVAVLSQWTDTASSSSSPVAAARATSKALNDALNNLRMMLESQPFGSFNYQLVLQSFQHLQAEVNVWESTWKKVGKKHGNPNAAHTALTNLQVAFINADATLLSLQIQQQQSGSISNIAPPTF